MSARVIPAFVQYDHRNEGWVKELVESVEVAINSPGLKFDLWYDRRAKAGSLWDAEIAERIARSRLILHMLTPEFFNKPTRVEEEYIWTHEMPAIEQRDGNVMRIPVAIDRFGTTGGRARGFEQLQYWVFRPDGVGELFYSECEDRQKRRFALGLADYILDEFEETE
jgi:hypothetical protein